MNRSFANPLRSLKGRLLLAIGLGVGAALLLIGYSASRLFASHVERQFHEELFVHLHELTRLVETTRDGHITLARPLSDPRFAAPRSGYYWQVTRDGAAPLQSASLAALGTGARLDERLATSLNARHDLLQGPTGPAEIYGLALRDQKGRLTRFTISADEHFLIAVRRQFDRELHWLLATFAILFSIAMWAAIRFALHPLDRLSDALAQVRQQGGSQIADRYPAEVEPLVHNINHLLTATSELVDRSRVEASQLAHSLRTPLAIIADEADRLAAANPERACALRTQVSAMQAQIDWHLAQARGGADSRATGLVTLLPEAMAPVIRALGRLHPERDIHCASAPSMPAACDPADFQEIFGNLLDNALRHAQGAITIRTETTAGHIAIIIASEDATPLPDDPEQCFTIGYSAGQTSSGLGLPVARKLARQHGGDVSIAPCADRAEAVCTTITLAHAAT